ARGQGLPELALLIEARAEVEEVLRLGDARDGVLKLGGRGGVVAAEHQLFAFFVVACRDLCLRLCPRGGACERDREQDGEARASGLGPRASGQSPPMVRHGHGSSRDDYTSLTPFWEARGPRSEARLYQSA